MPYRYCLVIMAGMVLASVPAAAAYAANGMTASTGQVLLLLHHLGMILLFGNIAVSSLWMSRARRTGERSILYYATRTISRADLLFTVPGLILIIGPGVLLVGGVRDWGRTSWAELALALMLIIFFVWVTQIVKYQRRMLRVAKEAAELRIGLSDAFYHYERWWSLWNGLVTVLLLASLFLMVFKPHLWGPLASL